MKPPLVTDAQRAQLLANGRARAAGQALDPLPDLGTVRLSELGAILGPQARPIERDLYFVALRTLSEYTRLAHINGSVID
ncbi:DUF2958 domain-containing protein [Pseudomonas guariconensis]|uniref:DUF2958 domain-containing protein n=1 Tax=Pseudomonas guariconensis TaxID=1288410 RepID=UPI0018AB89DC|nr:DUF2958 domain-containing protein [Pseudomonas guariconensis]MBF8721817.1 DUF2958 domain-containing protein [Pseudomonas guariconensis]